MSTESRDCEIKTRLSEKEYLALKRMATGMGISVEGFVRRAIHERFLKYHEEVSTLEDVLHMPKKGPNRASPTDLAVSA